MSEPLVIIGQGDNSREITEEQATARPHGLTIGRLACLWLAFAVLAGLWQAAKGGR